MTHIRDEADKAFDALKEEITIGERAHIPVQHSHIKLGTVGVWGKAAQYIQLIEAARKHLFGTRTSRQALARGAS